MRHTYSVQIPKCKAVIRDPLDLLSRNYANPVRYSKTIEGDILLSIDTFDSIDKNQVQEIRQQLTNAAQKIQKGMNYRQHNKLLKLKKSDVHEFIGNIISKYYLESDANHFFKDNFEFYEIDNFRITLVHYLPFFMFNDFHEKLPAELVSAPFYYAAYVNSRIHFGSIFYLDKLGWGLTTMLDKRQKKQEEALGHFECLCKEIKREAWENIKALYNRRLAMEYLIRNGLYQNIIE
jgi:hypothetical protein